MDDTASSVSYGPRPVPTAGSDIGNYRIISLLGAGGMGQVFLAEHKKLGRKVALKLLLPEFAGNPEVVSRFFHEAKAVNQINHEHIVEIVDFAEEPGGYNYFIMELLEGRDLAKAREEDGPFKLTRVLHVISQVCAALAASHAKGIVHRDLKPENIFLISRGTDTDFVKLLDFGIAKLSGQSEESEKPKTRAGMILGTPEYMSPEQAGGLPVDYRSDLYSIGVVTYWMLSDSLPYRGKSFGELMVKQLTTAPIRMPEKSPAGEVIPPMLQSLIFRCLERQPQKRVQSAGEILEGLAKLGVKGAITEPVVRLKPKKPRPPWVVPGIAVAAFLVLSIAFGIWRVSSSLGSDDDKPAAAPTPDLNVANIPPPPPVITSPPVNPAPTGPAAAAAANPTAAAAPTGAGQVDANAANHGKPGSPGGHRHKHEPHDHEAAQQPDDNTGMIDPFAN